MVKHILFSLTMLILLGTVNTVQAQKAKQGKTTEAKNDVKFLEDITVEIPAPPASGPKAVFSEPVFISQKPLGSGSSSTSSTTSNLSIESASQLQFKYAQLLDIEVELIQNLDLFKIIDEWLGVKYRLGGSSKNGIDCSAFMQVLFTALYGVALPRTAREQYSYSRLISRAEIRQGDMVFFNTVGGVSHVGMYLQNNKFVHASSGGVTISDLYEDYWMKRFLGVGRIEPSATASTAKP